LAKKSRYQIAQKINQVDIIPIFYHDDLELSKKVIKACFDGGVRIFEYTNRGDSAKTNFPALKKFVETDCPGMLIGIGSIINKEQAISYIQLGADFIVSPILDRGIANACNDNDIYWIPGCATPSEIAQAEKWGADIIKIFPGNVLEPKFIKSVKGPMSWVKLMPTGGVKPTEENLKAWFEAGAVCVGMGSQLITRDIIQLEQIDRLKQEVANTLDIIKKIKTRISREEIDL